MKRMLRDERSRSFRSTSPSASIVASSRRVGGPTRRQFLSGLVIGAAAGSCASAPERTSPAEATGGTPSEPAPAPTPSSSANPLRKRAEDQVTLGSTGIRISRLALGSGTRGIGGASDQTRLGHAPFTDLLVQSYERGITFWETADQYGAHSHLREASGRVGRQNVVLLTKTHARTATEMQADLERFMTELGTDYIDIVLLHALEGAAWTEERAGAMEYLENAKQRGLIRAHGVSCHSLSALNLAARTAWVDVDLARINPAGLHMDADPATVIPILQSMAAAGKGVIGMKILGEGMLSGQLDMALRHAVQLDCLHGFTMGFTSLTQFTEVTTKIASV